MKTLILIVLYIWASATVMTRAYGVFKKIRAAGITGICPIKDNLIYFI